MARSPLAPHSASPAELKAQLDAEVQGIPFLVFRSPDGDQRIHALLGERTTLGRRPEADVALAWDPEVSRLHAELEW